MNCGEKNKIGRPCGAPAVGGTSCCVMHSGRASELGSKGGRRRAIYNPDRLQEFGPPKSAADLRDLLGHSIIEVREGRLDPKVANSISYLGSGFLRAVEQSELEKRVGDLERAMEAEKAEFALGATTSYEQPEDSY